MTRQKVNWPVDASVKDQSHDSDVTEVHSNHRGDLHHRFNNRDDDNSFNDLHEYSFFERFELSQTTARSSFTVANLACIVGVGRDCLLFVTVANAQCVAAEW